MFRPPKPILMNFSARAQTEEDHSKGQHSKDTEHRAVSVVGGQTCADLEVGNDWQVDQKAEDPSTNEVPDTNSDEKVDRPLLLRGEWSVAFLAILVLEANEVPGIERQQCQRNH